MKITFTHHINLAPIVNSVRSALREFIYEYTQDEHERQCLIDVSEYLIDTMVAALQFNSEFERHVY